MPRPCTGLEWLVSIISLSYEDGRSFAHCVYVENSRSWRMGRTRVFQARMVLTGLERSKGQWNCMVTTQSSHLCSFACRNFVNVKMACRGPKHPRNLISVGCGVLCDSVRVLSDSLKVHCGHYFSWLGNVTNVHCYSLRGFEVNDTVIDSYNLFFILSYESVALILTNVNCSNNNAKNCYINTMAPYLYFCTL